MARSSIIMWCFYVLIVFALLTPGKSVAVPIYKDTSKPIHTRVRHLLGEMTLEEKIQLLVADASAGTSLDTPYIERLQIPRLSMTDGPHGASFAKHFNKGATSFPVGINMASTWNEELMHRIGAAIAQETLAQGRNVILGPCMNIIRSPHGGRNFESFSEDPYLASRIAVAYVKGVQSKNVIACPKHFACNNQEWHRMYVSAEVEERALREIYFPAFKACVQQADAWSIMAAYNKLNGAYCCENKWLLTDVLKKEWDFDGIVISDWGAVHSTIPTAMAGCDIEMGGTRYMAEPVLEAVKKGEVPESVVNDKVRRILQVMMETGIFDQPWRPRKNAEDLYKQPEPQGTFAKSMYGQVVDFDQIALDNPAHRAVALDVARESIVLLKNNKGVLPLDRKTTTSIAVLGPNAWQLQTGGGGSSEVKPAYKISPLEGILEKAGPDIEVKYAMGCNFDRRYNVPLLHGDYLRPKNGKSGDKGLYAEYFNNSHLEGDPAVTRTDFHVIFHWCGNPPVEGVNAHDFSVRWSGQVTPPHSGTFQFLTFRHGSFYANEQGDGVRLYIDGKLVIDQWKPIRSEVGNAYVDLEKGKWYDIVLEYHDPGPDTKKQPIMILGWRPYNNEIEDAAALAKTTDAAIICVGHNNYYHGENNDQGSLLLPPDQERLIQAVAKANPNTIVVLFNGNPVMMSNWIEAVPAVLEAWYPGQEGGQALAEILFGDVNPSAKLPVTFGFSDKDYCDYETYPGDGDKAFYKEGIFVGYRHFDQEELDVQFPFGHGLSYTDFRYSSLKTKQLAGSDLSLEVSFQVANSGKRTGAEVVQVYVRDVEASLPRPVKELKACRKIRLNPRRQKRVTLTLDKQSLSFFDPQKSRWVYEPGEFEILIGSSSRDIRLTERVRLR